MSQRALREYEPRTAEETSQLVGELIAGDFTAAISRLETCKTPLAAAQLVLAIYSLSDSVEDHINLGLLADAAGIPRPDEDDQSDPGKWTEDSPGSRRGDETQVKE